MTAELTAYVPPDWEQVSRAFIAEKERRTGSRKTVEAYRSVLTTFFGGADKTPDEVTPDQVHGFGYGIGPSGKQPSQATIRLRLAAISSFYAFIVRMGLLNHNPVERVQRPRVEPPPARGLDQTEVRRLMRAVPNTPAGIRDRAIVLALVLTGRRRSEVMGLRKCDLSRNGAVFYSYRAKGGKLRRRELPEPCFNALVASLSARGTRLEDMADDESLWGICPQTFDLNLRRYLRKARLPVAGAHLLRHTATKLRRDVGESIEATSNWLDHSSVAVTSLYLRRIEGDRDDAWERVAHLIE